MIDIDNIDDFPKLIADKSICFDAKNEIRRSSEINFECSELEYKYIIAEEELVEKYNIRLVPDIKIVMPDKNSLKRKTSKPRLLWLSFAAAVAVCAFVVIIAKDDSADFPEIAMPPEPKPKTEIIAETQPKIQPEPMIIPDKKDENKANISIKKAGTITKKPVSKTIESETTGQDILTQKSENKNDIPRPEDVRIERIASAFAPVEMMNKEQTVFVYQHDYTQTIASKSTDKIAIVVQKFSANVNDNIAKIFEGFKVPNILSRLSLDHGIDKEIDEWSKNNPDIPFNVFINHFSENVMKEIYDEKGTLVKVIFFTNKSLKYKSNKIYNALNIKK
jgi:hypothetical protein